MRKRIEQLEELYRQTNNGSVLLAINLREEWPGDEAVGEFAAALLEMGERVYDLYARFPGLTAQLY